MTKQHQSGNPGYNIQRIINRSIQFQAIDTRELDGLTDTPKINFTIDVGSEKFKDDVFEVKVNLLVEAKLEKLNKNLFSIKVETSGFFIFESAPMDENFEKILHIFCPSVIFPYMRETIDNVLVKGGMSPLLMNPVNFEALYLANRAKQSAVDDNYIASADKDEIFRLKKELEALKNKVDSNDTSLAGLKAKTSQLKSKK